jgi:cytochrome c oxidase subunit 4
MTTDAATEPDPTAPGPVVPDPHAAHGHPSEKEYVGVALILAVLTAIEVAVYYIESVKDFIVPILAVLMVTKFAMVVLWFMHLRFDSPMFRRLFVTGIILAIGVYVAALSSLHVLSR